MIRYLRIIILGGMILTFHLTHAQPTISSTLPSGGGVSLRLDEITINFSEAIQEPAAGSITIEPALSFSSSFDDTIDPKKLTLTINETLSPGIPYRITITGVAGTADPTNTATRSFTIETGSGVIVNNDLTSDICTDGSTFTINAIVIDEGMQDNFYTTAASGNTHSLLLEISDGFEFVSEGSISLETDTDIRTESISILNDSMVQVAYKLCSLTSCGTGTIYTDYVDRITLSGLQARVTDPSMVNPTSTYEIIRVDNTTGSNNDAEMPGLPGGSVFARLQITNGAAHAFFDTDGNTVPDDGSVTTFCEESNLVINVLQQDGSAIAAGSTVNFFVEGKPVTNSEFDISGAEITIDDAKAQAFINAHADVSDYPLSIAASVTPADGSCSGIATSVEVGVDEAAGTVEVSLSPEIENKVVPGVGLQPEVIVNPLQGLLSIRKDSSLIASLENYDSNVDPYAIDIDNLASSSRNVRIDITYTAFNQSGCIIGSEPLSFEIQKKPRSKVELDIEPTYCSDENDVVEIAFAPDDLESDATMEDFQISGYGISGSTSPTYNPQVGNDQTGYTFTVDDARQAAASQGADSSIIALSYVEIRTIDVIETVCRLEPEEYQVEVCDDVYGCRDCRPGEPCYDPFDPCDPRDPGSICYDPCLTAAGPCFTPLTAEDIQAKRDSLNVLRNQRKAMASESRTLSGCGPCGPNQTCEVIGENCRTETRIRYIQVCEPDVVGTKQDTVNIDKNYLIRYLQVPELTFLTATRQELDTVFCENEGTIYLLGGPGNTFEGKSFSIFDGNTVRAVDNYSFTVGEGNLLARDEVYQLIYSYNPLGGCSTVDTLDFRVVPVPDSIEFSADLPEVNDIPTFRYCIGDDLDSLNLPQPNDIDLVWRDDRGFAIAEGSKFLPPVSTDQAQLKRFTVERKHIYAGCASSVSEFYVQVGETPVSDYAFDTSCGNLASFEAMVTHAGVADENDTIQSFYWNFNDGAGYQPTIDNAIANNFSAAGVYDVSMVVETSIGCTDTLSKKVTVFDQAVSDPVSGRYSEDFNNGAGGWFATSENDNYNGAAKNSSWRITNVFGQPAWSTANDTEGKFNNNEYSWVESPCFNLDQWTDPLFEMQVRYNTQSIEGAVLQYQIQDGLSDWQPLGEADQGLNWYNSKSISASPGGSITGWSGVSDSTQWINTAYNLADVKQAAAGNEVRFRVAFASLDQANRPTNYTGFSFDNVSIKNKDRQVLVEHFTNVTMPSVSSERANVSEFAVPKNDVVYIQYHTEDGEDPFYYNPYFPKNTANDHLTRRYFYGLDGPGYTVLNGKMVDTTDFSAGWVQQQYSRESLTASPFEIDIQFTESEEGKLEVSASATRNDNPHQLLDEWEGDLTLSLTLAIVDNEVDYQGETLNNVFVQYLPFQGGKVQTGEWRAGSATTLELNDSWQVWEDAEAGEYSVIAIVQLTHGVEENQFGYPVNEVFQVSKKSVDMPLRQGAVTSVEDLVDSGIKVFPNPANSSLNVVLERNTMQEDVEWFLYSMQGKRLAQGSILSGEKKVSIDIRDHQQGIYLLQLNAQDKQYQHRVTIIR
ncbi:T9SS type A sorting domain-containing protein [Fulvivirga sp. RKSG066]|uniref:T9SS type A sorting domain-containing protein n=1 Tax=Fulvivirga aurantia TaxID=2529383 RepID=UPI0012BD309D|nr:T9SS type A sorting domain-containing protein [Fulvivirga aurantia]MTI20923.1 T9SS type A sorting domain-containing protein [Fulvivirga aurantia]